MRIGEKIKKIRKVESLTQEDFAKYLGVSTSYISMLEGGKKAPSEQLILSICRSFDISHDWMIKGEGEMYNPAVKFTPKGIALINEINRRLESPDRLLPLSSIAAIMGIDHENYPQDLDLGKSFPDALFLLIQIFKEGNKNKIDAVMSQLLALKPYLNSIDELIDERRGRELLKKDGGK